MNLQLVRGLYPFLTQSPGLDVDGNTIVITRALWNGEPAPTEAMTFEGASVVADLVENADGTLSYSAPGDGVFEYIATPVWGPARTRRVKFGQPVLLTNPSMPQSAEAGEPITIRRAIWE